MADLLDWQDLHHLGRSTRRTDEFMSEVSVIFTLSLANSLITANKLFERSKNDEEAFRKNIVIPLFRLKGFNHVIDMHGVDEHGRDIVCFLTDGFGNRINYGIQVKTKNIHSTVSKRGTASEIILN